MVREKAQLLSQGKLRRGEAVLPIMLATFMFEVLSTNNGSSGNPGCERSKDDEVLGFKAALFALGKWCY